MLIGNNRSRLDGSHFDALPLQLAMAAFRIRNPNIKDDETDVLYHLGITWSPSDPYAVSQFSDTKFVCMSGSSLRAGRLAHRIAQELGMEPPFGTTLVQIGKTERYEMFKARGRRAAQPLR